jgi:hypothetical protein
MYRRVAPSAIRVALADALARTSRCVASGASGILLASCDKVARRANHFGFSEVISSPRIKNKSLAKSGKADV